MRRLRKYLSSGVFKAMYRQAFLCIFKWVVLTLAVADWLIRLLKKLPDRSQAIIDFRLGLYHCGQGVMETV
jgi:hypothetical protein